MCCVTPHCCRGVVYTYGVPHWFCILHSVVFCVYVTLTSPFTVVVLCVCHSLLLLCYMYISSLTIALCVFITLHCRCVVHLSLLTVVIVRIHHSLPLNMHCMLLTVVFCAYHCCRYICDPIKKIYIYITYSLLSCNFSYVLLS